MIAERERERERESNPGIALMKAGLCSQYDDHHQAGDIWINEASQARASSIGTVWL